MDQQHPGGGAAPTDSLSAPIQLEKQFSDWLETTLLNDAGVDPTYEVWLKLGIMLVALVALCAIAWWITRRILLNIVSQFAARTKAKWDDHLVNRKVFKAAAYVVPVLIITASMPVVFIDFPGTEVLMASIFGGVMVVVCIRIVLALLNAFMDILLDKPHLADKPIQSYFQLAKIVVWILGGVLVFSVLFHKSPLYFLSAMGAMTAVLLLIFKDTILGFVASIQIAAIDMVRVGDWVSMPKYGADGDVTEINLTTVKVRNFDKTITTIPTYRFISDSFKNWRGMSESGGRRIKRAINLRISSVKFASDELLQKLEKVEHIQGYIESAKKEIAAYNAEKGFDPAVSVNGRHLTNIGIFRHYTEAYLKNNQHLNHEMTLLVRQLEPTEKGVPIEVYCFSANQDWGPYEAIQGDIFDHLLAAVPWFDLEVFEDWNPE